MHKISKFLLKLSPRERLAVEKCLKLLKSSALSALDIKKLKGKENVFRVRVGRIRIIFVLTNSKIEVVSIDRRNNNTYNF